MCGVLHEMNTKMAIITVAGISSRFNEGVPENQKVLKCLYNNGDDKDTLLYHLMKKVCYCDRIIVVGGYKYHDLENYYYQFLSKEFPNVVMVENQHYTDLASGYSLYLGIQAAINYNPSEILFVEGDLDIDNESFKKVVEEPATVLTYNYEPIYANKAVVLYKTEHKGYRYAFNSSHGMLTIDDPFSCIFNSGQTWKFTDIKALRMANEFFESADKSGTNLAIIQKYIDLIDGDSIKLIPLKRWTNCNTRSDYIDILNYWRNE